MSQHVPMHIKAGLPYGRLVTVTLPTDRVWWTDDDEFEVLFQMREGPDIDATLIADLTRYLTITFDAPNTVSIEFEMSGQDTRSIKRTGYYDMIMSDVGIEDGRAFTIIEGVIYRNSTITDAEEAST